MVRFSGGYMVGLETQDLVGDARPELPARLHTLSWLVAHRNDVTMAT